MAKVSEVYRSNYLQCQDISGGSRILRICEAWEEVVGNDSEPKKKRLRIIVRFEEFPEFPMIFNTTNARNAAKILGDDTKKWIGKQLLVYVDNNVTFGGKVVDGLRVKAPPKATAVATVPAANGDGAAAQASADQIASDDVPF
jgi:hypothetical protein